MLQYLWYHRPRRPAALAGLRSGALPGQTIGLGGTPTRQMHITAAEMQRLTSLNGLQIGTTGAGSMHVNGVVVANSAYVTPMVSLLAYGDEAQVEFKGSASGFHELVVQADAGIVAATDVTTSAGVFHMDGDYDNAEDDDQGRGVHGDDPAGRRLLRCIGAQGHDLRGRR